MSNLLLIVGFSSQWIFAEELANPKPAAVIPLRNRGVYALEFCGSKDSILLIAGGGSDEDITPMYLRLIASDTSHSR